MQGSEIDPSRICLLENRGSHNGRLCLEFGRETVIRCPEVSRNPFTYLLPPAVSLDIERSRNLS